MSNQTTIEHAVSLEGLGLFTSQPTKVDLRPAPANTGVVFIRRVEEKEIRIPAVVDNITKSEHRSTLRKEGCVVQTIEHCMAALSALGIDNVEIEVNADELPGFDGSGARWCDALLPAGKVELSSPKRTFKIPEPVVIHEESTSLVALPDPAPGLTILYELDYGPGPIGRQIACFKIDPETFVRELSTARSFLTLPEAQFMQKAGYGKHLTPQEFLVVGPDGPVENAWRFPDECVRHKILDLVGDLYLFGAPLEGRIIAKRTGHVHNHKLVRALLAVQEKAAIQKAVTALPKLDIRQIMRILPHRFPMLMVDKVVELEEDRRAVGIKNVSINELQFLGHYPGHPIMPGVLILEAMAQLGGLLLGRRLEHTGKLAVLLSMDNVKLRHPVMPGDQLVLTAETLHVRSRTGHVRCTASVGEQVAAEAEIKFMLVDADPI